MKRSLLGASGEINEKQPRRSSSTCNTDLSPSIDDENRSMNNNVEPAASPTALKNTLKENNVDAETTGDLPLLTDSFINVDDSSTEFTKLKKRITELEEAKSKVEADFSYYKQAYAIKGNFNEKERKAVSRAYVEKKQYKRRAETAEANILTLQDKVLKAKEKVKEKDVQRLEVQHKLNIVEDQLTIEKDAKEKALQDVKRLEDEVAKLNSNLGNKNDLIQHLNNKIKDGGQFITKEDTVTIAELQQTISMKDKAVANLEKCLEKAYAVQEKLKDEKQEAIAEKLNFENRMTEFREDSKAAKEKISKLEKQLENAHEKTDQHLNDIYQEYYEENELLKAQVSTYKEAVNEKNEKIAQLQKELHVSQFSYSEEIEKVKAEKETLEAELKDANLERTEMLKDYTKIMGEFNEEKSDAIEKMKKLESYIASLEEQLGKLSDTNSVILSDLIISRQNEQQKADELAAEIREHKETKRLKQIAQDFVDKAYEMNREEVARTAEANIKAAQSEAKFLQCQSKLAQEEENRQQLETKLKDSVEDLGNEIIERQNAITINEKLEKDKSQWIAELTDLKEKQNNLQKKYDQMKADNAQQKKNATNEYKKLEASNKTLIESIKKLKADISAAKMELKEKAGELKKFVQSFNAFCNK